MNLRKDATGPRKRLAPDKRAQRIRREWRAPAACLAHNQEIRGSIPRLATKQAAAWISDRRAAGAATSGLRLAMGDMEKAPHTGENSPPFGRSGAVEKLGGLRRVAGAMVADRPASRLLGGRD